MSVETWFRILFAVIAVGLAIYLAISLVTGRTRVSGRSVDRRAAPRTYWGSIGKSALMTTGLTIAVIQASDNQRLPIVFLGLVGGQLFEMLLSGTVAMPKGAYAKADRPGPYWRWVAFHVAIVLVLGAFVLAERTRVIIL